MTDQFARVAHILPTGSGVGGLETHLLTLLRHLSVQEFRPIVVLPETARGLPLSQRLGEMAVPVRFHAMVRSKWDVGTFASLTRLLRQSATHIVHVHVPPTYEVYPFLAARFAQCPVVVSTEHSASHDGLFRTRRARLLKRAAVALQDCVITVCDHVRNLLIEQARLPPRKLVTIHNGIEMPPEDAEAVANWRREFRSELGLEASTPLVGMVARIDPVYKRFDDFLSAAALINQKALATHFVIVGDGVGDRERAYRVRLEELAHRLGLTDRVHFLGFRDDAPRIISALDTLVLASDHEGFPLVTLEAMARGTPVVATALGGIREQIAPGETGYLVRPRDASALANAISEVLRDPQRGQEVARQARLVAERCFDARVMARRTQALYYRLLSQKRFALHQATRAPAKVP